MPFSVAWIAGLSAPAFGEDAKWSGGFCDAHTWLPRTGMRPPTYFTSVTEWPLEVCSFPRLPAWTGFKLATSSKNDPSSWYIPASACFNEQAGHPPCYRMAILQLGLKKHFCFPGLEPKIPLGVTHINVSRTISAKYKVLFSPPLIKLLFSQIKYKHYHHSKLRKIICECCQWNFKSTWYSFTFSRKYLFFLFAGCFLNKPTVKIGMRQVSRLSSVKSFLSAFFLPSEEIQHLNFSKLV